MTETMDQKADALLRTLVSTPDGRHALRRHLSRCGYFNRAPAGELQRWLGSKDAAHLLVDECRRVAPEATELLLREEAETDDSAG